MPATESIKERAVRALIDRLATMKKADGFEIVPDDKEAVIRGPLTDQERRKTFSIGVVEGPLLATRQVGTRLATLQLTLEMSLRVSRNDVPGTCINRAFRDVYLRLRAGVASGLWTGTGEPSTLGGLVADVFVAAELWEQEGDLDRQIEASMNVDLLFKHAENDPRTIVPGAPPPSGP